jgi:hypothetical protein
LRRSVHECAVLSGEQPIPRRGFFLIPYAPA